MRRRVVITGIGLISPLGLDTASTWEGLLAGRSGIVPISRFDAAAFSCRIAGEVRGFDPERFLERKEARKMDTFIHYAIGAAHEALQDSGLVIHEGNATSVGTYIGSGIGGLPLLESTHRELLERGPRRISPFFIPSAIINLASGFISIRLGAKGPNSATATACSASAHAVGDSYRLIQHGYAEVMICGGSEAAVTPMGVGGFAAMKALSTRNDEPKRASRPFDAGRDGFVVGEGAGILVLESLEHAQRRGANILAEVVGYGMTGDANHITQPAEDGDGAFRVMSAALRDAKIPVEKVGYVNAHGTSTPLGDAIETVAMKRVFGEHVRKMAVSSTKSMTGHLLGGAGGLEAGISVLALQHQTLPPTINYEQPDPACDLDYVPNHARQAEVEYALSNSFGFGGTNAALVFRRWSDGSSASG